MEKLLWIDMEMSGLDVEKEVIIEVAAIVTDWRFNRLDSYYSVVKQPQSYIDGMDEWNKKHHGESGLIAQMATGKDPKMVEDELIKLVNGHYAANERAVLAGNSIHQDRLFLQKHFKRLSERLHYRLLDVTSWKIVMQNLYKVDYPKKDAHRALDDINESIEELKFYLKYIQVPLAVLPPTTPRV